MFEKAVEGIKNCYLVPIEYRIVPGHTQWGLAQAWNWFLQNVPEDRVICNDDIRFAYDSLRAILETNGEFVSALAGSNACSCFKLSDRCVDKVGLFDEEISPGYAYYEDCDYAERMAEVGLSIVGVQCGVEHEGSQTIAAFSAQDMELHHTKFVRAQGNYLKKWGCLPGDRNRSLLTGTKA